MAHQKQLDSPEGRRLLAALRNACKTLPGVDEKIDGFGHTTFSVKGKSFVIAGMGEFFFHPEDIIKRNHFGIWRIAGRLQILAGH